MQRLFLSFLTLAALTTPSLAQDPPVADSPQQDGVLREQTIYIPYTKLRETFEKEGRGVFLPYEQFQELWKAARGSETVAPVAKPPTGAIITDIDSTAIAERDVVRVTATLTVEVLSKGWHSVPIRLGDAAIISAKIGNAAARIVFDSETGYQLLLHHEDEKPSQVVVTLEYAKAFAKDPGQNRVSFEAPQAPVNRWQIRIPQAGADINVQPMIAASEVPGVKPDGATPSATSLAEETVVLAFVGAAASVHIDWNAKAEGATGLAALVNVQAQQEVFVDEGVIRTRTTLVYDISRAELSQLVIEVPADQKVVNVFDPNVRQWDVTQQGDTQQIAVSLFQPTRGAQSLVVELERFLADANIKEFSVPVIKAVGVGRQQGIVVARVSTALRAEVLRRVALTQLDAAELPPQFAQQAWDFSYRYAALPFDLALSTEKVQPKIGVEELVEAYLEPEQMTLDLFALYTIERAGVFQLELDVPAGFEIRQVRGQAAAGAEAAAVDSHQLQGDDKTRLVVNLARKALGRVGLFVELQKRLDDPNLLGPTGESSEIPAPLPRVAAAGVERSHGRLVVFAPESLRLNPAQQNGVRGISFAEAYEGTESTRGGRFGTLREVLAFAYSQQPVDVSLTAERRKPYVTVRQLLVARVESGVVKYEATFFYDIRYSGVKSLRIDVPQDLAADIRNESTAIREKTIDPAPADLAEGYLAWSLTGETELIGQPNVRLTWERKMSELQVGKPLDLAIPRLAPADVDRASGQVVITKAESLDIRPSGEPAGLRPIDPQHDLMPGVSVTQAARAFEFQDQWSLSITATRYKLEEVKRTSIERAVVRMVVTRSRQVSVQAVYRIRSARQRLGLKLPAGFELDTQPLAIDGKSVALERGDTDDLFVPLVGQSPEQPFLLELRYTIPGDHRRLDPPEFLDDPAVQQVFLCVYLPKESVLLGSSGPWTDEFTWLSDAFTQHPVPRRGDTELIGDVLQGLSVNEDPAQTFPVDGTLYVYSALRPAAAPEGSLRLVATSKRWLHAIVFMLVAGLGIGLTRRSVSSRVSGIVLLVIALVLVGVFLPTFSQQIMDGVLIAAVLLVFLVWLSAALLKLMADRAGRAQAAEATAAGLPSGDVQASATPQAGGSPADVSKDAPPPHETGESEPDDSGQGGSNNG